MCAFPALDLALGGAPRSPADPAQRTGPRPADQTMSWRRAAPRGKMRALAEIAGGLGQRS